MFGLHLIADFVFNFRGLSWGSHWRISGQIPETSFSRLVMVVDTRALDSWLLHYFADLYNSNLLLFAVWTLVLTVVWGVFTSFAADRVVRAVVRCPID